MVGSELMIRPRTRREADWLEQQPYVQPLMVFSSVYLCKLESSSWWKCRFCSQRRLGLIWLKLDVYSETAGKQTRRGFTTSTSLRWEAVPTLLVRGVFHRSRAPPALLGLDSQFYQLRHIMVVDADISSATPHPFRAARSLCSRCCECLKPLIDSSLGTVAGFYPPPGIFWQGADGGWFDFGVDIHLGISV